MNSNLPNAVSGAIVAAGGIVFGSGRYRGRIAIIRRQRYRGEIALPKGKIKQGETPIEAAKREVREETGYRVNVGDYAGTTQYFVDDVPKVVHYFEMELEGEDGGHPEDAEEVAAVEWVTPADAVAVLTHREDRALISSVFGLEDQPQ